LIIEFTNIPNVGFLFIGLGALSNAIILNNYPYFLKYQYIILGPISLLWFIILWWPLKFYVYKKSKKIGYSDIIGKEVEVYSDEIILGEIGQVWWSGTVMNAKLTPHTVQAHKGDMLQITEIDGNILICSKKR
jgi:membrane protein implicated in regulation of membrane protease activity